MKEAEVIQRRGRKEKRRERREEKYERNEREKENQRRIKEIKDRREKKIKIKMRGIEKKGEGEREERRTLRGSGGKFKNGKRKESMSMR